MYWEKDAEDGVARKEEKERPKRMFMNVVKEDMTEVEVTEEDTETEYRNNWRWKSAVATLMEKPKEV